MNKRIRLTVIVVLFSLLTLFGCNQANWIPEVADDEILLQIKLDLKEDIGLLIVDYDANGSGGSGGTSNANKSLLKHDELILYTLSKDYFDNPPDLKGLSLRFTIITDYCDPNYENIYPAEYTKPMEAIFLDAVFGESYAVTITGDRTIGYKAVLNEQ